MTDQHAPSIFPPPATMRDGAAVPDMDTYWDLYASSLRNSPRFWGFVSQRLDWCKKPTKVLEGGFADEHLTWFKDGTLNVSENCLDRHIRNGHGNDIALIWEPNDPDVKPRYYTYVELLAAVCRTANALKELGVQRGDRVCIYMQMVPELAMAMLACARIGAIHSVVFGAFSAESLRDRINDSECSLVITQDWGVRGDKDNIPMKANVDIALTETPSVRHVLVLERAGGELYMEHPRDVWWNDIMSFMSDECPAEEMNAEDPLFILYTSGSTGKPKGMVHTTGGYLTYAGYTLELVFDCRPGDVWWCTADCGWITGHSYVVYGPMANRVTTVMYEGTPGHPDFSRFWKIVDRHEVTHFYTAPTALRALRGKGDEWLNSTSRSTLQVLGTVGEPIKAPEWHWYKDVVGHGRCPIVDTWWQTETGGFMLSPIASATPTKPGSATFPLPGIAPIIVDPSTGKPIEWTAGQAIEGALCIDRPWPGMARTIWGDHERFRNTYFARFPGRYFTGDGCRRDEDGYHWITGRMDDVINTSGHLVGCAEVEGAIGQHVLVAEAAVVGVPDDIKGEAIYAFVVLKSGVNAGNEFDEEVRNAVRDHLARHAAPQTVMIAPDLPKTRSGKIMRRLLRGIAVGKPIDQLGTVSTLANPDVVQELVDKVAGK